ncbi:uncharacterized protein BX663DRAFT_553850 [Cokeromyces recurvatus]|uniref:uncharacterized protein n=1 Tax=Cokeromyces recurvatus TaxID=90255 RepID=UPI00221EFABC|nr:uncharacterized protein BX663DRAFT_553850 [Cokeromyces recurvatus]KAI7900541.1 hypothetical protein BX663DRAFT_553850 [Cokeromyces recurvatus]
MSLKNTKQDPLFDNKLANSLSNLPTTPYDSRLLSRFRTNFATRVTTEVAVIDDDDELFMGDDSDSLYETVLASNTEFLNWLNNNDNIFQNNVQNKRLKMLLEHLKQ